MKNWAKNSEELPHGFKKVGEPNHCNHPAHFPPMYIVLKAGTYEYTCPACGHVTVVEVPTIRYYTNTK